MLTTYEKRLEQENFKERWVSEKEMVERFKTAGFSYDEILAVFRYSQKG